MPKAKSSREDRSATTFWMEKALKELAQSKANSINMTLTDLINRAVDFYLREGHKLDEEVGQKLAMVELAREIKESGKYELQLAGMIQIQKGLQARVSEIEKNIEEITTGELLSKRMREYVQKILEPTLERLDILLVGLNPA